ncbi:MAG: hypothetical protein WA895_10400 [Streptosporangiaceae bacterium]
MTAAGTGQARDSDTADPGSPADLTKARHLARHQVMGLTGTFLLGMAVNLIGLPSQTSGGAHIVSPYLACAATAGIQRAPSAHATPAYSLCHDGGPPRRRKPPTWRRADLAVREAASRFRAGT